MKLNKLFPALALSVITAVFAAFVSYAEETVLFEGEAVSSNWGQAWKAQAIKNDGGTFDAALLKPGSVIYVTYSGVSPEVVLQSWSGGEGWAKVTAAEDNGSVASFTYGDMTSAFKTEDMTLLDCLNVGDTGGDITVTKVTISVGSSAETEDIEPYAEETENEALIPENGKANAGTGAEGAAVIVGAALAGTCGILVSRKKK